MTDTEKYEGTKALLMDIYKEFAYGKLIMTSGATLDFTAERV